MNKVLFIFWKVFFDEIMNSVFVLLCNGLSFEYGCVDVGVCVYGFLEWVFFLVKDVVGMIGEVIVIFVWLEKWLVVISRLVFFVVKGMCVLDCFE